MDWKVEEDSICCEVCVYEYVIRKSNMDINTCIDKIKQHASICNREAGSIRQRIQNIKYWIDELQVANTIPVSPLSHAAVQTKKTLITCLENAGYLK
ncbi:MAG: hypothetical protein II811_00160 [Spirochaetaceae bacterium]|nr:hypothetical protein [Spirochaetaceae bacterium]